MLPEAQPRALARGALAAVAVLLAWAGSPAQAAMVCNTVDVGNRDFFGISGSSDSHVIAVGRNGEIYRYDGSNWAAMASGTGSHLEDVQVVSATLAWASGRNGTVLRYNGTTWTDLSPATGEELFGIWADGSGEVWAAGDKGEIHYYNGSVWTEVTGAAGAGNRDIEDVWGDAASVVAMDDRGALFRYDRAGGTWDAPDATCSPGDNFSDLWGDGAGNLYLADRDGVYRYDGATCPLTIASGDRLYGIHGDAAGGVIYGVGRDGTVLDFDGAAWRETAQGSEDLNDDWVSASGSAYYAGDRGELTACVYTPPAIVGDWPLDDCTMDFPGSVVADAGPNGLDGVTAGATSVTDDGALCAAAGLDGASGYVSIPDAPALDLTDGMSFAVWLRHDGAAPIDWEAVFAKGDSSYRLHLNGGCGIADALPGNTRHGITFGLNGGCGNADLNTNIVPAPGVWYHVAGSYERTRLRVYVNGVLINQASLGSAIGTNNFPLFIGENSQNRNRYWSGDIDEFTLWDDELRPSDIVAHMNRTRPCTSCGAPALSMVHDGYGIHCLAETVTVNVTDSLAGTPSLDYNEQVTLDTGNGSGSWTLVAGGGVLVDAVAGDGLATYDWPLGESTAQFALAYPAGPAGVDLDVYQTSDPSVRDDDSEGAIVFGPDGFTLTASALSNPPPAVIAPFSAAQTAGADFAVHLAAYGQLPGDSDCGIIESYTGPKTPAFWFGYDDPGTGTLSPTVDGAGIGTVEGSAAPQPVVFSNGQAGVTLRYKDAGRIQLFVKDAAPLDPALPAGIRGATSPFVVRPARFALSGLADGSGVPNPGAGGAGGPVFTTAGAPFRVTVTALDAAGDVTPNYGRESIAESVMLTPTLVAPAGGDNPPVAAVTGFGAFAGGSATGLDFTWPEVGIVTLTPSVADGSYLGAGDVAGSVSGNVGRFVPADFDTAVNAPAFATACAAGGYTYLGQPFGYAVPPVIGVTARAAGGTVTRNYSGAFFRLDNASLANRSYTAATGTLDPGGIPPAAADPSIVDTGAGTATLTFDAGAGLAFDRVLQDAFDAAIGLSIDILDADGVAAANPVGFAAPMAFDNGRAMRYGRIALGNTAGSELVDAAMPMTAQWYVDAGSGFVANVDDLCTAPVTLALGAFTGNLAAGETCVQDLGSPGDSGAGCAAPAPAAIRYRAPPLAGQFNLNLAAPGAGNDGTVTVTADVPGWLEFDWDAALPGLEDPAGVAAFGVYSGDGRRIYQREVY